MQREKQIGYLPLSALYGRRSASAEAAKLRQIRQELALSPRERVLQALALGESSHVFEL